MAHKRNVDGLRQSAHNRHQEAVQRTEAGIRQLIRDKRRITFRAVAEAASVSTAWLYQQPEIKQRIERLRDETSQPTKAPAKTRASDASKDAMIATLRQRIKQLEEENRDLKKQNEAVYGQLVHLQRSRHASHDGAA